MRGGGTYRVDAEYGREKLEDGNYTNNVTAYYENELFYVEVVILLGDSHEYVYLVSVVYYPIHPLPHSTARNLDFH